MYGILYTLSHPPKCRILYQLVLGNISASCVVALAGACIVAIQLFNQFGAKTCKHSKPYFGARSSDHLSCVRACVRACVCLCVYMHGSKVWQKQGSWRQTNDLYISYISVHFLHFVHFFIYITFLFLLLFNMSWLLIYLSIWQNSIFLQHKGNTKVKL